MTTRTQMEQDHATPRIGGSLAAVIAMEAMGQTPPFGNTSFDVWARWKGLKPPRDDTRRFEVGRDMEPALRVWHQARTGNRVLEVPEMVVHPEYAWYSGHLDGIEDGTEADWEGKTSEKYGGWDEDWSDPGLGEPTRVPMNYMLQNLWYNGLPRRQARLTLDAKGLPERPVVGAHERPMVMAVQFGLSDPLRIYRWDPDTTLKAVHAKMFEACARWWDEYMVKGNVPPAPSPREAKLLYTVPEGKEMVEAGENVVALAAAYEEARAKETEAKAAKEKAAADLCKIVGSKYGVTASNQRVSVRVTWAPYHKEAYTVKAQDGRTLRVTVKEAK